MVQRSRLKFCAFASGENCPRQCLHAPAFCHFISDLVCWCICMNLSAFWHNKEQNSSSRPNGKEHCTWPFSFLPHLPSVPKRRPRRDRAGWTRQLDQLWLEGYPGKMASRVPLRVVRALNQDVWTAEQFLIKMWTPECQLELWAFMCGGLFSRHGGCGLPSTWVFKMTLLNPVALLRIWCLSLPCQALDLNDIHPAACLLPGSAVFPSGAESSRKQVSTLSDLSCSMYFQEGKLRQISGLLRKRWSPRIDNENQS